MGNNESDKGGKGASEKGTHTHTHTEVQTAREMTTKRAGIKVGVKQKVREKKMCLSLRRRGRNLLSPVAHQWSFVTLVQLRG